MAHICHMSIIYLHCLVSLPSCLGGDKSIFALAVRFKFPGFIGLTVVCSGIPFHADILSFNSVVGVFFPFRVIVCVVSGARGCAELAFIVLMPSRMIDVVSTGALSLIKCFSVLKLFLRASAIARKSLSVILFDEVSLAPKTYLLPDRGSPSDPLPSKGE